MGHRLLTASSWSLSNRTLDIWKLTRDGIEHQFSFSPYPPGTRIQLPPSIAQFVDGDRLAVVMFHKIAIYDLNTRKGVAGMEFDRASSPSFDPTGRYVFGLIEGQVAAVDLATAELVARSPVTLSDPGKRSGLPTPRFSVSPDLTRLVTLRRRYLELYDLVSGERVDRFFLPSVTELEPVFLDEENIMALNIMGGSLIHVPLKSAIWNYSFCKIAPDPEGSGRNWVLTEHSVGSAAGRQGQFELTARSLPNPSTQKLIQSLTLQDLIVLRPGDTVALQLSAAGSGQSSIREQLVSLGFKIDPGSPNVLKATVSRGKSETREFQNIGGGGGSQSATFSSEYFQLELIKGGQTVWYIQGGSSSKELGNFVVLYEGDTVQSRANEGRISASRFFESIVLPEMFIKVPQKGFYGFSKGGPSGFTED